MNTQPEKKKLFPKLGDLMPKALANVQNQNNAPMVKLKGGLKLKLNMALNFNNVLMISDSSKLGNFARDVATAVANTFAPAATTNHKISELEEDDLQSSNSDDLSDSYEIETGVDEESSIASNKTQNQ